MAKIIKFFPYSDENTETEEPSAKIISFTPKKKPEKEGFKNGEWGVIKKIKRLNYKKK